MLRGEDMARPSKEGLDYFPVVVNFDTKVELICAEFGAMGIGVLLALWQDIYKNGYYIEWDNDVLMLFAKNINEEVNRVNAVITRIIDRGILSKSVYEKYGVLTSRGIQSQYLRVCKGCRRKEIKMVRQYCLVSDPNLLKLITAFTELIPEGTGVNDGITQEETPVNPPESTQMKGNKKKVQDSTSSFGKSAETFSDDSLPIVLSQKLKSHILTNNPNARTPSNLQKWASDFDKMIRLDKRPISEIEAVMEFSQRDNFWRSNILSAGKLREKYDQLFLQSKRRTRASPNFRGEYTDQLREVARTMDEMEAQA